MSISIDKKLLRKYVGMQYFMSCMPLCPPDGFPASFTWDYDGEWLSISNPGALYPAFRTVLAYQSGPTDAGVTYLDVSASIKCPSNDKQIYVFFFEPQKGYYGYYQGIDTADGDYACRSKNNSVQTKTVLTGEDWTTEHLFKIVHQKDQTDVNFYIDGVEKAHHTTNISAQPYEIACCEPNGTARTPYLKFPKGIYPSRV